MMRPQSKKRKFTETIHGIKIVDNYRWLEANSRSTENWISLQNRFTREYLDSITSREYLKRRFTQLSKIGDTFTPSKADGRYFFRERKSHEELPVLYFQDGLSGEPHVLIDQNKLSKDHTTTIKSWKASRNGKLVVYTLSEANNDQASLHVMDVDRRKVLPDVVPSNLYPNPYGGEIEWDIDNNGFWYTRRLDKVPRGQEKLHQKIFFHKLGTKHTEDKLEFGMGFNKEDLFGVNVSSDGRFLLINAGIYSNGNDRTEIYIKDRSTGDIREIITRTDAHFYGFFHRDRIFISTDHKAPRGRLLSAHIDDIPKNINKWKTIVPESREIIQGINVVSDKLFLYTSDNLFSRLRMHNLEGKLLKEIDLPSKGTLTHITSEDEDNEILFGFESFTSPHRIYRFDLRTEKTKLFKKAENDNTTSSIEIEQKWYKSKDGTKVPMFILHTNGTKLNGKNPTVLYGYGGFQISLEPRFLPEAIPFIENGGIYAIANIRGGGEFGRTWHDQGKLKNKQNSFDDFIAAAEWLIKNKYTTPSNLAIEGASNGGLLTAASMIQRPDLFNSVIMGVPVLDMTRFHLFQGGSYWKSEYGDPEKKKDFKHLLKYSPYHNAKSEYYPSVLLTTSDKDDRVAPLHAFKMTALLQELNQSNNPILLRVENNAGHSGAASKTKTIEEQVDKWSFIFDRLSIQA